MGRCQLTLWSPRTPKKGHLSFWLIKIVIKELNRYIWFTVSSMRSYPLCLWETCPFYKLRISTVPGPHRKSVSVGRMNKWIWKGATEAENRYKRERKLRTQNFASWLSYLIFHGSALYSSSFETGLSSPKKATFESAQFFTQ